LNKYDTKVLLWLDSGMMVVSDQDRIMFWAYFSDQDRIRILLKFFGSDHQILISAQHWFIIFVRTAILDSQPVTISVVWDSLCSEALNRTMLVWLLREQYDMCFIAFVTNRGVEIASNALIPK